MRSTVLPGKGGWFFNKWTTLVDFLSSLLPYLSLTVLKNFAHGASSSPTPIGGILVAPILLVVSASSAISSSDTKTTYVTRTSVPDTHHCHHNILGKHPCEPRQAPFPQHSPFTLTRATP